MADVIDADALPDGVTVRPDPEVSRDPADGARSRRAAAIDAILAELGLDPAARKAGRLAARGEIGPNAPPAEAVGREVAALLQGVHQLDLMPALAGPDRGSRPGVSTENLRRMLIAMIDDVRVVVIKLAVQLQMLREARDHDPGEQARVSRESLEVYAPLANRLGVWRLKWELEDLSLRYLEPQAYHAIAARLAERRVDRERYVDGLVSTLRSALSEAGISAEVAGRPKHIYSIWRKMQRKGIEFERVFDVHGVRILTGSVADCYSALGVVHTRWHPIGGEFDDYIATPKDNNYRSIHTAVIGPDSKLVEVQIRTHDMHRENELGVAAHWRYKESLRHDAGIDGKVIWLRSLLEWRDELVDDPEWSAQFRQEAFDQRVYVFTPMGKVVDLPRDATPLDFAYAIHSDIGHRCRGAKVNGRIVPLNHRLRNGEQVEILTVRKGGPSRDWLNPNLGYLHTARARAKVARWFKTENFEENVAAGRAALDRELQRLGVSDASFEKLAQQLDFRKVDDFLAAVGCGDLKLSRAVAGVRDRLEPSTPLPSRAEARSPARPPQGIEVQGVGNLLTRIASCCQPLPGDDIVGFITHSRGITVHRRDCGNVLRLKDRQLDRLIEVHWGRAESPVFPVDLQVEAFDRPGLLHDITSVLHDAAVNLRAVELTTDERRHLARARLTVDVGNIEDLSKVLSRISRIPNVSDVRRLAQS